ncbi:MAG TPA: hypothetical protein PK467_14165, partial [Candidatus Wallbacteria bacterium]|nr:hypothetical protein [Candidatus Wallbacteria bacterium]
YARNVNVNVNSFGLYDVIESAPAAFNDEQVFLYCYSQKDYSGEISLNAIYSYYPYMQFNNTKLHITPDRVFRPQMHKNNAYLFFSTKPDASIAGAGNITGRVFMARSDDGGINYSSPIFIDYLYGTYDQLASAKYNSKVYMVKKTIDKSPNSNFALSSIPSQLMMFGAGSSAFSFDCDMAPVNNTDRYQLDETVTAFSGDDEGNMLCATTNGLYIRNVKNANAILNYSTYGSEYKKGFVLFPLSLTRHEKYSDTQLPRLGWQKFFPGMHITSVYAEKSGNYWVATLKNGIYRSVDYGRSWTHIEARMSGIVDINHVSAGRAANMNKLNLVTRRYNVNDAERKPVLETLFLIYDLATNVIESFSVLASEEVKNPGSADGDALCSAVNSPDNSKIFYFNPQDSCIYYKKPDLSFRNALQAFSAYSVNENYNKLQLEAEKDDRLELIVSGRFKGLDSKYCFLPSAIANVNFYSDAASINSLQLKINDEESDLNHYYFKAQQQAAAPYVRIKNYIENSAAGEKSYIYEANYQVDTKLVKASRKLTSGTFDGVTKLVCGPDEDTLYAVCREKNKVYAISGIKEMKDIKISEYSAGLEEPVSVLFPPFASGSKAKAYITCKNNILEISGSRLISSAAPYDIADSLLTDGNVLLFYDSLSRKVYKCPRASQKNVFVSVIDKDEGAAINIAPVNISKKFYSFNYNSPPLPARKYIKYNYIYTSRDYPAGIRPESPQNWTVGSASDEAAINVYVIDSNFEINGELTMQTGVTLKFATADKRKYSTDFSGRSDAILKCIGGRL